MRLAVIASVAPTPLSALGAKRRERTQVANAVSAPRLSMPKGMTASGGAAGVGRAVNQSVVISLVGVFVFNYAFTAFLLATHPGLQTIR